MKINFGTVLNDVDGKPLLDVTEPGLYFTDGRCVREPKTESLTLQALCMQALRTKDASEAPTQSERNKTFALLIRIAQGGEVEVSKAECTKILDIIAKEKEIFNVVHFGRAKENLDPTAAE